MSNRIEHSYVPTPIQAELHADPTRFKVIVFGRRSGKSTFGWNEGVATCLERPNMNVWIVCPTFQQAKDIYWRGGDISRYLLKGMYKKKNDSDLMVEFDNGSILQLKSAERPDTLKGSGLDLVIWDEVALTRNAGYIWEEVLGPSLSDKHGRAIFISTPKGYNYFYDLYEIGLSGHEGEWRSWKIPTSESGAPWTLTKQGKQELKNLEDRMTEDAFAQEYGADFRRRTGLVFPEFSRETHIRNFEIKTKHLLEMGMDFGYTNPTAFIFSYFDDDDVWYLFDEYYEMGKTIFEHSGMIRARREQYPNGQKAIFGDSEDPQSIAEYSRYGLFITPVVKYQNSLTIGIDRIADRLKVDPKTGEPRMYIHPNCRNLIKELESYAWKEYRGDYSDDIPEKGNDHAIDAMRYIILTHTRRLDSTDFKAIPLYNPEGAGVRKKKVDLWKWKE
jgi:hypothetical protein